MEVVGQSDDSFPNISLDEWWTKKRIISEPVILTTWSPVGEKGEECHSNLISSFLTFTSLVLSNVKENGAAAHLCFDILLCISEDNYANAFMHDDNQVFSVFIYRTVSWFVGFTVIVVYYFRCQAVLEDLVCRLKFHYIFVGLFAISSRLIRAWYRCIGYLLLSHLSLSHV